MLFRSDDGRLNDGRLNDGRLSDGRLDDGRLSDGRLDDGRLDDGRLDDGRLSDGRLSDGRLDDCRPNDPGAPARKARWSFPAIPTPAVETCAIEMLRGSAATCSPVMVEYAGPAAGSAAKGARRAAECVRAPRLAFALPLPASAPLASRIGETGRRIRGATRDQP